MFLFLFWSITYLFNCVHAGFFCAQFRPYYRANVSESAPPGSIVGTTSPSGNNLTFMNITGGDTGHLKYDNVTGNILVITSLSHLRQTTLQLQGKCQEHIPALKYTVNIEGAIMVDVLDLNDPPVFKNLPSTVNVRESAEIGSVIFVVEANNPTDVDPLYDSTVFTVLNVTGSNRTEALKGMFLIDTIGRVRVRGELDYEEGLREYFITIQVSDRGKPPLRTVSQLHVYINDSDDQTPVFRDKLYTASVIGEKPVVVEECHPTHPPLFAEDQDPVVKSSVRYHIKEGIPLEPWHWQNFFFLDAETGFLCQRETIPRAMYKRGDQTVKEVIEGFYNFTLTVESYQTDNRSKSDTATLHVNVLDQNSHAPTFHRRRYRAEVQEYPAVRAGTVVVHLAAEDEDYGKNSLFEYELLENPSGAFWIDSTTGEVKVNRPQGIDREKNDTMVFKVRATETSTPEKKHSDPDAIVEVTVLDDNDNRPQFRKSKYRFEVKDSTTVGTSIHRYGERVAATDPDLGENGTVRFSIMSVQNSLGFSIKDSQRFRINRENGVIRLDESMRDLRRLRKFPVYTIRVKAEDQSENVRDRRSSVVQVLVKVVEANDFPPFFENSDPVSYISEAATVGSLITKVKARDEDGDEDIFLKFRIVSGNEYGHFRINDKGYMFTNKRLDRETRSKYTFLIEVTDGKNTAEATLTVHVTDTNDHAPVFNQSSYDFTLSEDARTNHVVGGVMVTDEDEGPNGQLVFSLFGEYASLFDIKKTGEVYLKRRSEVIDREKTERITLQARAEDLGQPPAQGEATLRIRLLDVNDNRPVFSKSHYTVDIVEEQPGRNRKNKAVSMEDPISAEDEDKDTANRDIVYSLRGDGEGVFRVDPRTGRLSVRETRLIDCEKKCAYRMKVIARDQGGNGLEGSADLSIKVKDINDNTPVLARNYTFRTTPKVKVGSVIGDIDATDADKDPRNKRLMYILRDGGYGKFRVDFDTGRVIVVDKLTREPQMSEYNLTVEVMDTGDPRLSSMWVVKVQVPVNSRPVLEADQTLVIKEDVRTGSNVGKVKVKDSGDVLKYRLSDDGVPFRVGSDGSIRTTRQLDRESEEGYTLEVVVTDRGYPVNTVTATLSVVLQDVNDNPPTFSFSSYSGEVTEDDSRPLAGQAVHLQREITATDEDESEENRDVVLTLRGEGSDMFDIDSETGTVTVRTPGSIDCEQICLYKLKIHAQDRNGTGFSDDADLQISVKDINDNSPEFPGPLTLTLDSLMKPGVKVGNAKATDRDTKAPNNALLYVLTEGGDGKFELDPYTGDINLMISLLEEPRKETYTLHVKAFDFGNPSRSGNTTVSVHVPLNFAPEVENDLHLSVRENVSVGTYVGQIEARDVNVERGDQDEMSFYIDEALLEDVTFPFQIDPQSGVISTRSALDREETEAYDFGVYVVDSLLPVFTSSTSVHIDVQDENDSPPVFTSAEYSLTIPENTHSKDVKHLPVTPAIAVTDNDTPLSEIQYSIQGEGSHLFDIDPTTGALSLVPGAHLDSEARQIYNITILASDGSHSCVAVLTVTVEDVNDHAPVFKGETTLNITSDTPSGTVIGQVKASDDDVTERNNGIMYYITNGGLDKFVVHPKTGKLQVTSSLLEEPYSDRYELTVRAVDLGVPQKFSDITVSVFVPINYRPQVSALTEVHVQEDIKPGSDVVMIRAVDRNVDLGDDKLTFHMDDETEVIPFKINEQTGLIKAVDELDREIKEKYSFVVKVTDSKLPQHTVSTTVVVTVDDVNDNPPVFSASGYQGNIKEDDTNPTEAQSVYLIQSLKATDTDSTSDELVFSLSGKGSELFYVNTNTGEITQREAGSLDAETNMSFNLTLTVSDGDHNTSVPVLVMVEDINDHAPEVPGERRLEVDPHTSPGTLVMRVGARDRDQLPKNKQLSYYLLSGGMGRFTLHRDTGELYVSDSLTDGILQDEYSLQVLVTDHGFPPQSTEVTYTIDVPVNYPPRLQGTHLFSVGEDAGVGTVVGEVVGTDRNLEKGEQETLHFFIDGSVDPGTLPFTVERETGRIVSSRTLDRESESQYIFTVLVTDSLSPVYSASSTVTVALLDVNDNAPEFSSSFYTVSIPEDRDTRKEPLLPLVPVLSANDADGDSIVYTLEDRDGLFNIDSSTGAISVRDTTRFDAEDESLYNLTVSGSDGLHTTTVSVTVTITDVNDNAPVFNKNVTIHLDPFIQTGRVVTDASATDADIGERNNEVQYYLLGGGLDKFHLNEDTGEVSLVSLLTSDPKRSEYNLKVRAYDKGTPQQQTEGIVTIRTPVNYRPEFNSSFTFHVKENVTVGTGFGHVTAVDKNVLRGEADVLNYFIDEQSTQGVDFPFYIERDSGHLVVSCVLDREKEDNYNFHVVVTDSKQPVYTSSTLVSVTVDDVNDNPPQFKARSYTGMIKEDDNNPSQPQRLIIVPPVAATDIDKDSSKLTFDLTGPGSELFDIDSVLGNVKQKRAGTLDADVNKAFNLTLVVSDGQHETTAHLFVEVEDANDNAPVFLTSVELNVDPLEKQGTVIGQIIAVDRDSSSGNGDVAYYLQSGGLDKFSVDSSSGDISLIGDLLESPYRDEYQLTIRAVDFGQPQLSDSSVVTVRVPLNHAPSVSHDTEIRVGEDETVGAEIGRVKASDPDGNDTSHLQYKILDTDVPFSMETNGGLVLTRRLDSERRDTYRFPVLVVDQGTPSHTVTTTITVHVYGVNDEKPVFSHSTYTAAVEENLSVQDALKPLSIMPELSVSDGDSVEGGPGVVLELEGEGSDVFILDSATYHLTVRDPTLLDCETTCVYNLIIVATDEGGTGLKNYANLTINVIDVNDNAPYFSNVYNFTVSPDARVGTLVGVVDASDADNNDVNNRVTYLLTEGGVGKFRVDPNTGRVTVADSLLRTPLQDFYKLKIQARDSGFPSLHDDTTVVIEVPSNKPPIVQTSLTFTVDESIPKEGYVGEIIVDDPDASAEFPVVYSLLDHTDTFKIHRLSGELRTLTSLDADTHPQYIARVEVEDPGSPTHVMTSTVTISLVDINDNYPQFSSPDGYRAEITENDDSLVTKSLHLIPEFGVVDRDRDNPGFVFQLTGPGSEHFIMDQYTGEITVDSDVDIDCETQCMYKLNIIVTDELGHGLSTTAPLTIDVEDINDNPPDVTSWIEYHVSPTATIGQVVGEVRAVDLDNSTQNHQLNYLLTGGGFGKFEVGFDTGIIKVSDSLTREPLVDKYTLSLTVRDTGFPSLSSTAFYTISVPINKPPVFKPARLDVLLYEDVDVGTVVADVGVEDEGGLSENNVTYDLFGHQDLFIIDESGIITTAVHLDAEQSTVVDMTATVVDHGLPDYTGTTAIHVDINGVNDNVPAFSSNTGYTAQIREDVGLSSKDPVELFLTPGLSVSDVDGDRVTLSLSGKGADTFSVDPDSQVLSLLHPDRLDCERTCSYNLTLVATDDGDPSSTSSATLLVDIEDVNEHAPEFARVYVFPVPVDAEVGTVIGYIEATDRDFDDRNSDVTYSLKSGGYDKFAVHSTSGALSVTDSLIREPHLGEYHLQVEAKDQGYPQLSTETQVTVTVPVNVGPVLPRDLVYNVTEDLQVGEILGTVTAVDVDLADREGAFLDYTLVGGDDLFTIDRRTGDLILFDDLDAEIKTSYELTVKVQDHGYPSMTSSETIFINVQDINDHPPVFSTEKGYVAILAENADVTITPIVEIVPELSAHDGDVDGSDQIRFRLEGTGSEDFLLDPTTGQLRVRMNTSLDADRRQLFNLVIAAIDSYGSGLRSEAPLDVHIVDVNDNPPVFREGEGILFPLVVDPSLPIGTVVYTLVAHDVDVAPGNSRLTYLLQNGGMGKFSVDSFSGEVKIADDLSRAPLEKDYYLSIQALDSGTPQLSAETVLHLHVPLNTRPEPQLDIQLQVPEDISVGELVGRVYMKDFDAQSDFRFLFDTDIDEFSIDPRRGEIRTVKLLDAELKTQYELPITVIDHGVPIHTVSTTATVTVTDVDDNLPHFSSLTDYTASLREGGLEHMQEIQLLPGLSVSDDDITAGYSEYKVYLKGRGSQLFEITPDGAHVFVKDPSELDAETDPSFDLQIVAENVKNSSRRSAHNLTISVEDQNDHAPSLPAHHVFQADPGSRIGSVIGRLVAIDEDVKSPNNQVMYIMREDGLGRFGMHIDKGDIFVKNNLTMEPTYDEYTLKIEVIDKGFPALTGSTTVTVNVPVNKALTVPRTMTFSVDEDAALDAEVGRVDVLLPDAYTGTVQFVLMDENVPFSVNSTYGIIRTAAALDADTRPVYTLEVGVANIGTPTYTSTSTVTVNVGNVNDNAPEFTSRDGYTASVEENYRVEQLDVIPSISVVDVDRADAVLDVKFSLEGNGSELFTINPLTAVIAVKDHSGLDAEQALVYNLTIIAADEQGKGFRTPAQLKIKVKDVNDNAPRFDYVHNVKVDPRSPVDHKVVTVKATDDDGSPENNRLLYFLNDGMGKFRINPLTGTIRLTNRLTEEPLRSKYELTVRAVDSGLPARSANTTVHVTVDLNQPPVFELAQSFHIQENQPINTRVGHIDASDPDGRALEFTSLDFSVPLSVDRSTGVIRTTGVLDREQVSHLSLPVQVIDRGSPSFTGTAVATVHVLDLNDNIPTFNVDDAYHGIVPEVYLSLDPFKVFLSQPIVVHDADPEADHIQLTLSGEGSDLFEIDQTSGHLLLISPEEIDAEQRSVYNLTLTALDDTDGLDRSTSVSVYIDVDDYNDNPPVFERDFEFDVATNTPVGAEVGRVEAVDRDVSDRNNKLTFILKSGGYGKFQIDSDSGAVSLSDNILREPVLGIYTLHVQALDSGLERLSAETQVTIRVPVNFPPNVKDSFTFSLEENLPAGSDVGEITLTDPDIESNPFESFEFSMLDRKAPFTFKEKTGMIVTTRTIDRERDDYFILPVQVINPGAPSFTASTTVTVDVIDLDDNDPVFSLPTGYLATVLENMLGTSLNMTQPITVSDADSTKRNRQTFLNIRGEDSDMFSIDQDSGFVSFRKPRQLDAEKRSSFNLTVVARSKSGKGRKSTTSLTINVEDVNDNIPRFPRKHNMTVAAASKVGQIVGKVTAEDGDVERKNNRVTYLLRGGARGKFDIDPDTGDIIVLEDLTVKPFRHVYHLSVEAIDSGEPRLSSETVVRLSVNLNKPPRVPKTAEFQVGENQTAGSVVGQLLVTDPDSEFNPREQIEFFTGEPSAPFTVEHNTGVIRMASELDRETNDHFELPVVVINKGSPSYTSTSHVTVGLIDINDNPPVFSSSQYVGRIVEDSPGTQLEDRVQLERLILVTDSDVTEENRGVVVSLSGPHSDHFTLDTTTGQLNVNRPVDIDCETVCQYDLQVHATDQLGRGLTSTANLTVLVEDINDHAPLFRDKYNFSVSTGSPVGQRVGVVTATDLDRTIKNNRLTYLLVEGGSGKFDVNPESGEVYVSDTLKREPYRDVFTLHIQAVDNGFPRRSADVNVDIHVPMNRAPHVDSETSMTVAENLPVGSMVGKITVTDPDSALNSQEPLEYHIMDDAVPFEVDKHSGELKLMKSVDREEMSRVSFNVHIVNDGAPTYTMSTMVTVLVNDTNDHAPEFSIKGGYCGRVSEDVAAKKGEVYVTLNHPIIIEDKDDTEENRNVEVKMTGAGSDNFLFDKDTGKIRIKDVTLIDAEKQQMFNFKLTATDQGGTGLSTSTNLTITVDDVNDNTPVFTGNLTFTVDPASSADSKVGVVSVTDADVTPQNSRLTFLLTGGGHGKFRVDSITGEIQVSDSLLREPLLDEYNLKVKVQDNGVPQRSAEAVVSVRVPVNHPPRLFQRNFEFHLAENNAVGAVVGLVTASDPDIPSDPHQRLVFSGADDSGTFSVDSETGEIIALSALDRETTSEVTFNVNVTDNVYPNYSDVATVTVLIDDVNDNPPLLQGGDHYTGAVHEDDRSPIHRQIVKLDRNISVVDHDATLENRQYFIYLDGHASKFFRYDSDTGHLLVTTPGTIDREFNEAFDLRIIARDLNQASLSSAATVHIEVADSNDNPPEFLESTFTFTLPSVVKAGDIAGKVVARDVDATEPNNKMMYLLKENPLGKFQLDINTGDLTLLQSFYSKPRKDAYSVTVEARDMGYPFHTALTTVIIRAPYFHFNDHPPDFKGETMFVTREEVPVGSVVGRLNVVDEDRGVGNSSVTLEMLPSASKVPFRLEADGAITCVERIDRDRGPNYYTFKVRATDTGSPPFNVTRDISVIVDDVNDNPPKFSLRKYRHMVTDTFPPRTVVATPIAFDNVDEKDSVYHYSMKGDLQGYFHINTRTGVVITTDMASTLDPQTLTYEVEAVDLYDNRLKARTELEIQVIESAKPSNDTCK